MKNHAIFEGFPGLRYGLSGRQDGFMNVKTANDPARDAVALENRRRFFGREGVTGNIFIPYLVHGNDVQLVSGENWQEMPRADGFVAQSPGIVLTITVADCFPLFFYDPVRNAVGLAHSGWRGTVKNILGEMVKAFAGHFGSRPADLCLGIGPGIRKCHFSVRDDVAGQFPNLERIGEGEYPVDLPAIIAVQAREAGVRALEDCGLCTHCLSDRYFSYRRDKPAIPEVMAGYIGRVS